MENDGVAALWRSQSGSGFCLSSEEIRQRIDMMNRKMRRRTIDGYLVWATMTVVFGGWTFIETNKLLAIGAVLSIIGFGYLAWQMRANRFRSYSSDASGTLEHLRNELARQRDFHRGSRFWWRMLFLVPGPLVFFAGFAQAQQANPKVVALIRFETISFVVFALAAIPLNAWMARRYQKQIDALARLQEEK